MKKFWIILLMLFSTGAIGDTKHMRGLNYDKNWKAGVTNWLHIGPVRDIPSSFDWRVETTLSPVMDQGNCGSCWAFSASETFRDDQIAQQKIPYSDTSTQQVLDCSNASYSCNGGMFDAGRFFVSPGSSKTSDYGAYTARKSSCKSGIQVSYTASQWFYVAGAENGATAASVKSALIKYGPVSIGVAAGSDWDNYNGGILQGSACKSSQMNHAVEIVGYKDDSTISGGGYWIVRNSWSSAWGESGYIRLAYNCDGMNQLDGANVFVFGANPSPVPPSPVPPSPSPTPCTMPTASTGYGPVLTSKLGKVYVMGSRGQSGASYVWSADPPFVNNAVPTTAQIRYKPAITKIITVTATNTCGAVSASTQVIVPTANLKYNKNGFIVQ